MVVEQLVAGKSGWQLASITGQQAIASQHEEGGSRASSSSRGERQQARRCSSLADQGAATAAMSLWGDRHRTAATAQQELRARNEGENRAVINYSSGLRIPAGDSAGLLRGRGPERRPLLTDSMLNQM
ncbi:hypothetical protein NL676_032409 [Syzygium grande]|nr:hypothetical protein NL676_032409 [Syzygium grande]